MNLLKTFALIVTFPMIMSCAYSQSPKMVGAFGKFTKLTEEENKIFKLVVLSHVDLQHLKPIKVSRQVVAGTNYCYKCVDVIEKKNVDIVVYQPLPRGGEAYILSINGKAYNK